MNIQNLIREKVIANIKTGTKGENGIPKKLPYFNVEEDKTTSSDMVDIFKQLYPEKPTKLKIRFTSEEPFNFKFKRYVNGKALCIGNGENAITIGKDEKGNNAQVTVQCTEECEHRLSGKCKLVGSLKFVLEGINAGGLWKLNTSGGLSLSNIASEIMKYKKAGMSIVNVPFELSLQQQESLAYGIYYSLDLRRTDIKPELTVDEPKQLETTKIKETKGEIKQIDNKKTSKTKKEDVINTTEKEESKVVALEDKKQTEDKEETTEQNFSNYLIVKGFMPTIIKDQKFNKIIFEDINSQDVEYILHPKADQKIMECGVGSQIELVSSKLESDNNILCKYNVIKEMNFDEELAKMQKAV